MLEVLNKIINREIRENLSGIVSEFKECSLKKPVPRSNGYRFDGFFILDTDYVFENFESEELEYFAYTTIMKTKNWMSFIMGDHTLQLVTYKGTRPFKSEFIKSPIEHVLDDFDVKWSHFSWDVRFKFDEGFEDRLIEKYKPRFNSLYRGDENDG